VRVIVSPGDYPVMIAERFCVTITELRSQRVERHLGVSVPRRTDLHPVERGPNHLPRPHGLNASRPPRVR